jgi:hypothetical protein
MIITMRDLRAASICGRGAKLFFERHSLDWRAFVKNGISAADLEKTGDAMALRVVEVANARRGR